jgi:hypothetical protein
MSPFISVSVIREIFKRHEVCAIYTSWRPDHLLSGASSLELYEATRDAGVALVINDRLHAKVFANGKMMNAVIGSANLTANGLGISKFPNIEAATVEYDIEDSLRSIFSQACATGMLVTDQIFDQYQIWFRAASHRLIDVPPTGGPDLSGCTDQLWMIERLPYTMGPRALWDAVNIEHSDDPTVAHDLALFGNFPSADRATTNNYFRIHLDMNPFVSFILDSVRRQEDGIHFGGLKELIQSACTNEPMPWRRDLTEVTRACMAWLSEIYVDELEVIRPRYSAVIRRRHPPLP